ncbi:MAG: hypothetical protein R6X20_00060 [Phycisphaerae bacterium]
MHRMRRFVFALVVSCVSLAAVLEAGEPPRVALNAIPSPVLFRGDAKTAYRDPTAVYHEGWFRLFFTLVRIEKVDGGEAPYSYTAWSRSRDLVTWSEPRIFTPRDRNLNYCSPGNIVRDGDEWVLCLQTYPRPHGETYGNASARIWTMRSRDLEHWGEPELLRVKGPDVPREKMGRMIDAYLLEDMDVPGKWWCFYKQRGMSMSWSRDLRTWTYAGRVSAGENACVIVDGDEYVLFHSPRNGIGVKRSRDLRTWRDEGVLTLGQPSWPWARGRLTAGFVLDLRDEPAVGKALMFMHGSAFPENDPRGGFDTFASVGIAWSDDLKGWRWPPALESRGVRSMPQAVGRESSWRPVPCGAACPRDCRKGPGSSKRRTHGVSAHGGGGTTAYLPHPRFRRRRAGPPLQAVLCTPATGHS